MNEHESKIYKNEERTEHFQVLKVIVIDSFQKRMLR